MTKQTINNSIKQAEDLKTITHSLFCACLKYEDKNLTVDKDDLIGKIMDNCKVTTTKANEYLKILKSRNVIEIDHDLVIYCLKEKNGSLSSMQKEN